MSFEALFIACERASMENSDSESSDDERDLVEKDFKRVQREYENFQKTHKKFMENKDGVEDAWRREHQRVQLEIQEARKREVEEAEEWKKKKMETSRIQILENARKIVEALQAENQKLKKEKERFEVQKAKNQKEKEAIQKELIEKSSPEEP